MAAKHRAEGFGQAVAAPIIVDGSIWGHIAAYGEADEILPPGCGIRLADYTNLMASAISNVQARDELRSLAEQQGAALRRVATLVAQQASPSTIFNAVAGEASRALRVPRVDVGRCHEDGSVTLLGSTGRPGRPNRHAFSKSGDHDRVAPRLPERDRLAGRSCPQDVLSHPVMHRARCPRIQRCELTAASPVRSSLAVDVVHRPAVAWVHRSRSGIGSASAAREAGAGKGSAKYWVSWVTRSPVSSMTLTE